MLVEKSVLVEMNFRAKHSNYPGLDVLNVLPEDLSSVLLEAPSWLELSGEAGYILNRAMANKVQCGGEGRICGVPLSVSSHSKGL